jgi:hypothetical protein
VLNNIEANLEIARNAYVYSNIVLADHPVPGSIHVFKNGVELANDPGSGWTYEDKVDTVYTVTEVAKSNGAANVCDESTLNVLNPQLNKRTGYVIKLHGCGRMLGSDVPNVKYEKQ